MDDILKKTIKWLVGTVLVLSVIGGMVYKAQHPNHYSHPRSR